MDKAALEGLLERVEKADAPDIELDIDLWGMEIGDSLTGGITARNIARHWDGAELRANIPTYTASIDAALALVEQVLPGVFYLIGKGRVTASEPLCACQLLFGTDSLLAEAEHDIFPHSIVAALLKALIARAPA